MAHHILIIGGGIGGTMTANHLVGKLYPEVVTGKVRITMLSNSPWHYYKPAFMYVAFNAFFRDELRRRQRGLLRPEIDFQVEEVERFDFALQSVHCRSGIHKPQQQNERAHRDRGDDEHALLPVALVGLLSCPVV
jgi:sulfide:quinone oxidoreductase